MSVDKLVDSTQLDSDLTSVANAIRTKGGTSSQMSFPSGFVSAIENIHTGSTPTGTKEISITENGTTTEDVTDYAYAEIEVAVPASAVDSGTKNITANGTGQDVVGYAAVDVAVPNTYAAGDEGKVVTSGALVSQTAHADVTPTTSDQTINTTTNNSIKVKGDADLVAGNIKKDVEIFGVTGSYEGSGGGYTEAEMNALIAGELSGDLTYTTTTLGRCFANATGTFTLNFPNLTTVRNLSYLMENCQASNVKMPLTTSVIPSYAIYNSNITTFFAPNATAGIHCFRGDTKLETLVIGKLANNNSQCYGCYLLKTADIVTSIGRIDNTFQTRCDVLDTLILRGNSILQLYNITAFNSTPFRSGGTGGDIYIPKSLYDHLGDETSSDYKAASNWSTIDGYGTITWHAIEGSYYETHYADGTLIPTT